MQHSCMQSRGYGVAYRVTGRPRQFLERHFDELIREIRENMSSRWKRWVHTFRILINSHNEKIYYIPYQSASLILGALKNFRGRLRYFRASLPLDNLRIVNACTRYSNLIIKSIYSALIYAKEKERKTIRYQIFIY